MESCEIIIEAGKRKKGYLKELVSFGELIYFFSWRDTIVRYKQAFFGISWALIRPLLNMAAFAFFFGRIANLPSDHVNYCLFVLAGMLPWQFFSNTISETCMCLINNNELILKVYFPRMILPFSQVIVQLIDYLINFTLIMVLVLVMRGVSLATLSLLPFCFVLNIALCFGASLWLSALTLRYRDVRFLIPFMMQFGMFVSPVGYGTFMIAGPLKWLYYCNPIVGIIDCYRFAFFGIKHADFFASLGISITVTMAILVSGWWFFRRLESTFADKI